MPLPHSSIHYLVQRRVLVLQLATTETSVGAVVQSRDIISQKGTRLTLTHNIMQTVFHPPLLLFALCSA